MEVVRQSGQCGFESLRYLYYLSFGQGLINDISIVILIIGDREKKGVRFFSGHALVFVRVSLRGRYSW